MTIRRFALLCSLLLFALPAYAADVFLTRAGEGAVCPGATRLTFEDAVVWIADGPCDGAAKRLAADVSREDLRLVRDRRAVAERTGYRTLYERHGYRLALVDVALPRDERLRVESIDGDRSVLVRATPPVKAEPNPDVLAVLDAMDATSYGSYITGLAGQISSRYACTPGIESARDALVEFFTDLGYDTTTQSFGQWCYDCDDLDGINVMAVRTGTTRPDDWYVVGAHFDSYSGDPCNQAPGANDNASGTAGVMELARVFAAAPTEATIVFVAFGSEELGLIGSNYFVNQLNANGLLSKVKGFVVMDMVSYYKDTYGGLLEGSNANQAQIAAVQHIAQAAATYTSLTMSASFSYWGSDHEPFLDRGVGGALLIETDWSDYAQYHTVNDRLQYQDMDYGLEMVRAVGAALGEWAVVLPAGDDDDDTADDDDDDDDDNDDNDDDADDDDDSSDDDTATGDDDDDDDDSSGCGC